MTNPDARDFIDWNGIHALPPAQALSVLGRLADLKDNPFTEARLRLVGATVREEIARHRPGAQARAAKTLNVSPALLGRLYAKYKENFMIEIPNTLARYDLLDEVEEHFDTRQAAHNAIQTYLDQIIDIDGEDEVVMDRKPLKNSSGRVIGETLWVTEETANAIRSAIGAEQPTPARQAQPIEDWERALLEGTPDTRPKGKVNAAYEEAEGRARDGWEVAMAKAARETALLYTNPDALAHMVARPRWDYPTDTMTGYTTQVRNNVHAEAKRLGLDLHRS